MRLCKNTLLSSFLHARFSTQIPITESASANQQQPAKAGQKPKLVVLTGTTAVGKSRLAALLAQRLNGELISADSVKVFRPLSM
jgi:2-phosphoglycerate kinase